MTNHPYTLEESARLAEIQADSKRRKRNEWLYPVLFIGILAAAFACAITILYFTIPPVPQP